MSGLITPVHSKSSCKQLASTARNRHQPWCSGLLEGHSIALLRLSWQEFQQICALGGKMTMRTIRVLGNGCQCLFLWLWGLLVKLFDVDCLLRVRGSMRTSRAQKLNRLNLQKGHFVWKVSGIQEWRLDDRQWLQGGQNASMSTLHSLNFLRITFN